MGRAFETLTVSEIVEINRRMIQSFGGIFFEGDHNLANPGSLEYVLAEIQGALFGKELHPSIFEKAAAIGWRIIAGYIFHDGNKRTGMEARRLFLDLNGYMMRIDNEAIEIALRIAKVTSIFTSLICVVERSCLTSLGLQQIHIHAQHIRRQLWLDAHAIPQSPHLSSATIMYNTLEQGDEMMAHTMIDIVQPFVQRGLFATPEKAVTEMAQDYVLRQIERYRATDERLHAKYGMTYDQFEAYLRARSTTLAAAPDVKLNQAVMLEEEDAHDWKIAREMLQSWLGLQGEVAA